MIFSRNISDWGMPDPFCERLDESDCYQMGMFLESISPNDAIVYYPVEIAGQTHDPDGVRYHITIRWGKWHGTKEELVQKVRKAIQGIDTKRPQITDWRPEVFYGRDGKRFYVLRVPVDDHVKKLHNALTSVFGPPIYPDYKAHISVEQPLWEKIKKELLLPGDIGVRVLPLEVALGHSTLQQLGEGFRK